MISEGPCDAEHWSIGCWKFSFVFFISERSLWYFKLSFDKSINHLNEIKLLNDSLLSTTRAPEAAISHLPDTLYWSVDIWGHLHLFKSNPNTLPSQCDTCIGFPSTQGLWHFLDMPLTFRQVINLLGCEEETLIKREGMQVKRWSWQMIICGMCAFVRKSVDSNEWNETNVNKKGIARECKWN